MNSITGGHGTPILGIIGANSGNDLGISGIVRAPSGRNHASMMLIKTAPAGTGTQEGTLTSYYQGVYYAVMNGADIINASWGFERDYPMPRDIQEIIDATSNVLIVAAVGNFPNDFPDIAFPARYPNTLAVTSSDCFGTTDVNAAQSGPRVDVAAPAGVLTLDTSAGDPETFPCDGTLDCYGTFGATSSAAPHVSGTAAMMLAVNPYLSALNIAFLIRDRAIKEGRLDDFGSYTEASYTGSESRNDNTGYGLLNAVGSAAAGEGLPAIGNVQWRLVDDGDDRVNHGDEINITWDSLNLNPGDRVNIDLLDSLGNTYPMFANIPANSLGVNWVVPDDLPDNKMYLVKIRVDDARQAQAFSKNRILIAGQNWITITSQHSEEDYYEYLLIWETSYSESTSLLLEVGSGEARGLVFIENSGTIILTHHDLDSLLKNQDPENYVPQFNFQIRLLGSPDTQVTSAYQGLVLWPAE